MPAKLSYLLNLLLAAVLVIVLAHQGGKDTPEEQPDGATGATTQTLDCIMTRTSVRDYLDKDVDEKMTEQLLRAAMAAPTAGNRQPWRFVVVRERATLDTLAARFKPMQMAAKAPLAIVVCGDLTATFTGEGQGYWIQDCSAATENLLLAAHAMDLGAVWCGVAPLKDRMDFVSRLLNLPDSVRPLNVVCIGWPAAPQQPKDKWHPEYIHQSTWQ